MCWMFIKQILRNSVLLKVINLGIQENISGFNIINMVKLKVRLFVIEGKGSGEMEKWIQ